MLRIHNSWTLLFQQDLEPFSMRTFLVFLLLLLSHTSASASRLSEFNLNGPRLLWDQIYTWNPCLAAAFRALQAWKHVITSDPNNVTGTWVGYDVCNYMGVFCAALPPSDANATICNKVVSGIDLNRENLTGTLPEELGHLQYLAFFHINTNRFYGTIPHSISRWRYLYELDVSNNLLSGTFPLVTLHLPSLFYLDLRFNSFNGPLPDELFNKPLDAIFINNNIFDQQIPETLGKSTVSAVVFANNFFTGDIPASVGEMKDTLNEIIFLNNNLTGSIPSQFGNLQEVTVLDISSNDLSGTIPSSIGMMSDLEQLDVAHNDLTGQIPNSICTIADLQNFTASYNFFSGEAPSCLENAGVAFDDEDNCIVGRPDQRSREECTHYYPPAPAPAPEHSYVPPSSSPASYPEPVPAPEHSYVPPSYSNESPPAPS